MSTEESPPSVPKKRGRPRKTDVAAKAKGGRKQVGRPKGDAAIINEYKARMLASPKSRKVLEVIFDAALDNEHKNQAAAWKLVMDRIAPIGAFEKDVMQSGGRNSIQINISGVPNVNVGSGDDPIDAEYSADAENGEYTDVDPDDQ